MPDTPFPPLDPERFAAVARLIAEAEARISGAGEFLPFIAAERVIDWIVETVEGATLVMRAEPEALSLTAYGITASGGDYGDRYALLMNWLAAAKRRLAESLAGAA